MSKQAHTPEVTISRCPSCNQLMHGSDYLERVDADRDRDRLRYENTGLSLRIASDAKDLAAQRDKRIELEDRLAALIASAPDLLAERDSLRETVKELSHYLDKSTALISRGLVEGAYTEMVGGDQYAERIWNASRAAIAKAQP